MPIMHRCISSVHGAICLALLQEVKVADVGSPRSLGRMAWIVEDVLRIRALTWS